MRLPIPRDLGAGLFPVGPVGADRLGRDNSGVKRCTKCGVEKPLDGFYFEKGKPRGKCKVCHRAKAYEKRNADRDAHNVKRRKYHAANRERINAIDRERWRERGPSYNAKRRDDRAADPAPFRDQQKAWRDANLERARETQRRSHARHKDRINAEAREDRRRNPQKYRERDRAWRERNRETVNAKGRTYYAANRHIWEVHRRKREARKAGVEWQPYTRREIWERDGGKCRECDKDLPFGPGGFQIDHIVPISLGGPDTPANVQLMCPSCNRRKWANLEGQIHLPV